MNIIFEEVGWINFLSYGNYETKVNLNSSTVNLFVGTNGAGKSVFSDALCFVLFGKAYRKINKGDLVNRFNKKNCQTWCNFKKGNDQYKVIRTIKPDSFKIYRNGEEQDQIDMRVQQEYFEKHILGFDYNVFSQLVLLGTSYHTPYMRLKADQKRDMLEQLFDLEILVKMKEINKEQAKKKKIELSTKESEKEMASTLYDRINEEIQRIKQVNKENLKKYEDERMRIDIYEKESKEKINILIKESDVKISELEKKLKAMPSNTENEAELLDIKKKLDKVEDDVNSLKLEILNLEQFQKRLDEIKEKQIQANSKSQKEKSDIEHASEREIMQCDNEILSIEKEIRKLKNQITYLQNNESCEYCGNKTTEKQRDEKIETFESYITDHLQTIEVFKTRKIEATIRLNNELEAVEKSHSTVVESLTNEKNVILEEVTTEKKRIESANEKIEQKKSEYFKTIKQFKEDITKLQLKIREVETIKNSVETDIRSEKQNNQNLLDKLSSIGNEVEKARQAADNLKNIISYEKQLEELKTKAEELDKIDKGMVTLKLSLMYMDWADKLLSESGIRTSIIGKYLEMLNKATEQWLSFFNAQYHIEFNEKMETSIYIRKGEYIDYESFSGGERQRIDMAIMFTFMTFSKMKSGVSINTMLFDEVLDSSLDEVGIDDLFTALDRMAKNGSTINIISHRPTNLDRFQNIYKVFKTNNLLSKITKEA